jgi:hypothetical protein
MAPSQRASGAYQVDSGTGLRSCPLHGRSSRRTWLHHRCPFGSKGALSRDMAPMGIKGINGAAPRRASVGNPSGGQKRDLSLPPGLRPRQRFAQEGYRHPRSRQVTRCAARAGRCQSPAPNTRRSRRPILPPAKQFGDARFKRQIAKALGLRVAPLPEGRPRKAAADRRHLNLLRTQFLSSDPNSSLEFDINDDQTSYKLPLLPLL